MNQRSTIYFFFSQWNMREKLYEPVELVHHGSYLDQIHTLLKTKHSWNPNISFMGHSHFPWNMGIILFSLFRMGPLPKQLRNIIDSMRYSSSFRRMVMRTRCNCIPNFWQLWFYVIKLRLFCKTSVLSEQKQNWTVLARSDECGEWRRYIIVASPAFSSLPRNSLPFFW